MQGLSTTQPSDGLISFNTSRFSDVLQHGIGLDNLLTVCREMNAAIAVVLLLAGLVFLLWGFYAFKTLVLLNAAAVGGWLGFLAGQHKGSGAAAAAVGVVIAAVITWPLMKYAVAVMGGLIGTVIGMAVWRTVGLNVDFATAGGGMGLIFFGMLSFILFRTSVMMFTSIQGAAMLIFGLLCLVYKLGMFEAKVVDAKLLVTPAALPLVIGLAALIGVLYQNSDTATPAESAAK